MTRPPRSWDKKISIEGRTFYRIEKIAYDTDYALYDGNIRQVVYDALQKGLPFLESTPIAPRLKSSAEKKNVDDS